MIGNDVIDLRLAKAQSNWKRKGFLEKLFTIAEQRFILEATDSETMVWILWSRKEAAYKIFNRETSIRSYNPLQFECLEMVLHDGFYYGKVTCQNYIYHSKTGFNADFVYTIAAEHPSDFGKIHHLENRGKIRKVAGIPSVYDPDTKQAKPVSISHHGNFERIISI
jgi:phosphopantetheinyl transferase (holo-ACP synthase)